MGFIEKIGLKEHLSPNRANGLSSMYKQIKFYALAFSKSWIMTEKIDPKKLGDQVVKVLKTVYDPEIPVDIYELGLIYDVFLNESNDVKVLMTLTTPNCPVADSLPEEVKNKIKEIPQVNEVEIEMTFDPPWSKDLMSEEAKLELGFL